MDPPRALGWDAIRGSSGILSASKHPSIRLLGSLLESHSEAGCLGGSLWWSVGTQDPIELMSISKFGKLLTALLVFASVLKHLVVSFRRECC